MTALVWLPILAKAVTTALLVVVASALAEALGPLWGALVASLPVSAGPAYVFLAMQHGGDFVAASALSSAAANAATGLFLIVYAMQARAAPLWRSLGVAVIAWLTASLAIRQVAWTPATAILVNLAVYGSGFIVLRETGKAASDPGNSAKRHWFDLPLRAVAVALFVSTVVGVSSILGPEATGIAAVFPISLISLIVILHPSIGGAASVRLASTALRAMLGFGLMLLVLHLAIQPLGTTAAFLAALLVSLVWSGGLLILSRRPRPVRRAVPT
ncbi:hypothetical protein [Acidisphaera sp. S103]|uniref:hypothetical protein n=1 Tax=Acidisphaera sp. S103 TaxID=1747223 RepID=UPI00131C1414|nr:hypothetical protein [Acidisphaera sp. S103]